MHAPPAARAHLGALIRTMFPYLPTSSDPCRPALPSAAAALSVAATRASSIVRPRRTQAKCITIGYGGGGSGREGGAGVRGWGQDEREGPG